MTPLWKNMKPQMTPILDKCKCTYIPGYWNSYVKDKSFVNWEIYQKACNNITKYYSTLIVGEQIKREIIDIACALLCTNLD